MAATAEVTPINTARLGKEQGRPRVGSVLSPHRASVADSLTPQRLGHVMRRADEGDIEAFLTLAQEMEERDCHYRSVLHTRKMAVSGIAPLLELPDDSPELRKVGTAIEEHILGAPSFEGLLFDLMDGIAKGFSCVEILWDRQPELWRPTGYAYREQRHFALDRDTMSTPLLRTDSLVRRVNDEDGDPLNPFQWIVHRPQIASGIPIRTGLARVVAVSYAAKRWTCADWLAFLDIYGIPIRLGKYPASHEKDKLTLLRAVRALGSDAAAVIPEEMTVELLEVTSQGGAAVFRETVEYFDKQTSKAVLGQTMSTDDGASLAQSKTHEQVRFDIRDADCRSLCSAIDAQLIQPFVNLNFGIFPKYPRLRLPVRRPEDGVALMQSTKVFVDLGGQVEESVARDRLGYPEPAPGAVLLKAAPKVAPPGAPGEGDDGSDDPDSEGDDDKRDAPAGDDEEVDPDARAKNARQDGTDAVDDEVMAQLAEWEALTGTNVGELLRQVQSAESFDEARARLERLARDAGQVLDVGAFVVSLARSSLKLRGLGDRTDDPEA